MSNLRQPPKALLFSELEDLRKIVAKKKLITFRHGWRDFEETDRVVLCSVQAPFGATAIITQVKHTTYGGITRQECLDNGYRDKQEMLKGEKEFYPGITWDSEVTVIRYNVIKGLAVEHPSFMDVLETFLEAVEKTVSEGD